MSGNPKECRQHALNCAAELESMESLLGTLRQVKSDGQVKPIDEQKESRTIWNLHSGHAPLTARSQG